MEKYLKFSATILQNENMDAAYVEVPYDIKELFGKGRLLVNATFDGVPYRGQVVKMGTPCYIIGVTRQIRRQIGKSFGDVVEVVIREREARKSLCGNVPDAAGNLRIKTRVITVAKSQRRLTNISLVRMRINRKTSCISARFSATPCRKRRNVSHGVCQPSGKSIIFFTLPRPKGTSDCTRDPKPYCISQRSFRTTKPIRERSASPMARSMPH